MDTGLLSTFQINYTGRIFEKVYYRGKQRLKVFTPFLTWKEAVKNTC